MRALMEAHDRSKVEVVCVDASVAAPKRRAPAAEKGPLPPGCDELYEANQLDLHEAARGVAGLRGDFTLDMAGHASQRAIHILSARTAYVQASFYSMFPFSTGAPTFSQGLFGDRVLTPPDFRSLYSEALFLAPAALPFSVNVLSPAFRHPPWLKPGEPVRIKAVDRTFFSLSPSGFLFASFVPPASIEPSLWSSWMEILRVVPNSQLWLQSEKPAVQKNLRLQCAEFGIHPSRIVVTDPLPAHLEVQGMALADLFLDTQLVGASMAAVAAAVDAGLPILTAPGDTFARRTAASVLATLKLDRVLVARNRLEYERLAIRLARHPKILRSIRDSLTRARPVEGQVGEAGGLWDVRSRAALTETLSRMATDVRLAELSPHHLLAARPPA